MDAVVILTFCIVLLALGWHLILATVNWPGCLPVISSSCPHLWSSYRGVIYCSWCFYRILAWGEYGYKSSLPFILNCRIGGLSMEKLYDLCRMLSYWLKTSGSLNLLFFVLSHVFWTEFIQVEFLLHKLLTFLHV